MITTTLGKLHEAGACESGYKKLLESLGGLEYGKEKPITFLQILESNGLDDTLWAFRAATEVAEGSRIARLFAADCAEHTLHIFEKVSPDDKRPHKAIEVARAYAEGKATDEELAAARAATRAAAWDAAWAAGAASRDASRDAARDAAWDAAWAAWAAAWDAAWDAAGAAWAAARDAAWAAARDAAWDAGDAEKEWQKETLIRLLTQ